MDLNPIFYEYTKDQKQAMIEQIINNDNFKLAYYIKAEYLEEQVSQLRNNNVINRN